MCMYKKSNDSKKVPTLNTHGEKNDRTISTHPMVAATVTSMGGIGGRYGLVSVQIEDFLRTFANSIFNSLLVKQIHECRTSAASDTCREGPHSDQPSPEEPR